MGEMPSRRDFIRAALAGAAGIAVSGLFDKSPEEPSPEEPQAPAPTPEELARREQEAQERALKEREEALSPERIREAIAEYQQALPHRLEVLRKMKDNDIVKLLACVMRSEEPNYISIAGLIGVAVLNRWKNSNKGEKERSFWKVVMGNAEKFGPQDKIRKFFSTDRDPTPHDEYLLLADMLVQTGEFSELYRATTKKDMASLRNRADNARSPAEAARLRKKVQDTWDKHCVIPEDAEKQQHLIGPQMQPSFEKSHWWRMSDRFQFLQTMFLHVAAQQKYYDEYQEKVKKGLAEGATVFQKPDSVKIHWEGTLGVKWINPPLGRAGIKGNPDEYILFGVIVGEKDKEGLREEEFHSYMQNDMVLASCFPSAAKRAAA